MGGERVVDRYVVAQLQRELRRHRRVAKNSGKGDRRRGASDELLP